MNHKIKAATFIAVAAALSIHTPAALSAPLPQKVGQCSKTFIVGFSYRLEEQDKSGKWVPVKGSGTTIDYTNGGRQVSYDVLPAIFASKRGDPVMLCLKSIPDCRHAPPGDVRGKIYGAKNLRTGKTWILPDSQHFCGGA